MAPQLLQLKHYLRQLISPVSPAFTQLTEFIILTIGAGHITAAEKYRAASFCAGNRRFLPAVNHITENFRENAALAKTAPAFQAVNLATAGADLTGGQRQE
jgi:hypothetical protein